MSRTVRLNVEMQRERAFLARALVCGQLAAEAPSPVATLAVLMATFPDARTAGRGAQLSVARIVDELEEMGAVRITEWPEVEVLREGDAPAEAADPGLLEWSTAVLNASRIILRQAA